MLSEYTEDLNSLFQKSIDADYFKSHSEALDLINFYLSNVESRETVAASGLQRVNLDEHDSSSRVKQVIIQLATVMEK